MWYTLNLWRILYHALLGFAQVTFYSPPLEKQNKHVGETSSKSLPTLYELYTKGGIERGLETKSAYFQLNQRNITLYSGAIHYFRVHPVYWRDRLRKLRAAGFNAVETYIPWNLHEPQKGQFDFGAGDSEMSVFLDVRRFILTAMEEDLLVIIRPGPYICAEWEFGGLPSWLLRYPGMKVRSMGERYVGHVVHYFNHLLPILRDLQFTTSKGPIIAFQIENEYAALAMDGSLLDVKYLDFLKQQYLEHGLVELVFTSDNPLWHGNIGQFSNELLTANLKTFPETNLKLLKLYQPEKPLFVMEYWSGWMDHWFESTNYVKSWFRKDYADTLEKIVSAGASVNIYMFHGGTNFAFYNGANAFPTGQYSAVTTSYDYEAPLTEAGDYTEKYHITRRIIAEYNRVETRLPLLPVESTKRAYKPAKLIAHLSFDQLIDQVPIADRTTSRQVECMERLPINNMSGQSYGYIIYRHHSLQLREQSTLLIKNGSVLDMGIVLVNGKRVSRKLTDCSTAATQTLQQCFSALDYWGSEGSQLVLRHKRRRENATLDIFVENWGRNNIGVWSDFDQRKGLLQDTVLTLDDVALTDWEMIPLQFKGSWVKRLKGWQPVPSTEIPSPTLFLAKFTVEKPYDTFLNMKSWGRGIVFINGFNLGRYFSAGPVYSLYLPAPLLQVGVNEVMIFELFTQGKQVTFSEDPIWTNEGEFL